MHEKMVDFTKELEYSLKNIKEPRSGNIISGKVVSITPVEVFIDIDWFQEITIPVEEFNNPPLLNDEVFIYCYEDKDGEMQFSKIKADEILQKKEIYNKYDNRIPVEGKIVSISRDKKYFNIEMGLIKGICYVDDLVSEEEKQLVNYIGKTFKFMVKNYNSKYIVLSRKLYITNQNRIEKSKFFKEKRVGDIVEGVVKQIIPSNDGVEFDLGGFSGFVPASEVSYSPYKPIEESIIIGEQKSKDNKT
ncbi:MAG TPA: S1 RNA-binding domain-containing protein [Exilispira sp.]|nr:S1 RNA-binding domain-containing protein [Exilispira sp.]